MKLQDYAAKAVEVLKEGGIVIFPTDTAFGIGCRLDDEQALARLYSIRRRPKEQAAPVLVSGIEMAKKYATRIPLGVQEKLLDRYWPGGLTVILPAKKENVPSLPRGGGMSVGLRMPNHPVPLEIIATLGVPVLGPSANFHGEKTPYLLADIDPGLHHLVDYIVPGVCSLKRESTVIDCTVTPWKIVRQGAIKLDL